MLDIVLLSVYVSIIVEIFFFKFNEHVEQNSQ